MYWSGIWTSIAHSQLNSLTINVTHTHTKSFSAHFHVWQIFSSASKFKVEEKMPPNDSSEGHIRKRGRARECPHGDRRRPGSINRARSPAPANQTLWHSTAEQRGPLNETTVPRLDGTRQQRNTDQNNWKGKQNSPNKNERQSAKVRNNTDSHGRLGPVTNDSRSWQCTHNNASQFTCRRLVQQQH